MLQKCYNRNNSVTNGENGSKSAIAQSGHQIVHCQNWSQSTAPSRAPPIALYRDLYTRRQAGKSWTSWKLKNGGNNMKLYYGEDWGRTPVYDEGIAYIVKHFSGKTFYAETYDKLIKKLGMKVGIFEKYVLVKFGKYNGKPTVTIIGEN